MKKIAEQLKDRRVLCLVDGQHYPTVIQSALDTIDEGDARIVGVLFLGGTEKIADPLEALSGSPRLYGESTESYDLERRLSDALADCRPEVVVDLSDAPILDYRMRYRLATRTLRFGAGYVGADFIFYPPRYERVFHKPSIAVIGTGKRIGKTAVSIHIARCLSQAGWRPLILTMGRGGPSQPEVIESSGEDPVDRLLAVAASGRHAASDYWEDAVLSDVPTIGCRRCGGGLFGSPFDSNVIDGARKAEVRHENVIIVEGSGPTIAPLATDATILVAGADDDPAESFRGLARYRLLNSDAVVFTGCGSSPPEAMPALDAAGTGTRRNLPVFHTRFTPEPTRSIEGKRVFLATTAAPEDAERIRTAIEEREGCRVSCTTTNLGDREALRRDLAAGLADADVLVTEVKAASIDVAAETARERGKDIVLMHNAIHSADLDGFVCDAVEKAAARYEPDGDREEGRE